MYFVGDNESGKTVALSLLNWLCYRPMLGVTIPSADIYGYLDDSEAPGTILEDEAQGLNKDLDKSKIYKAGYKQGAVVPRTMITQNKRFIKYFPRLLHQSMRGRRNAPRQRLVRTLHFHSYG